MLEEGMSIIRMLYLLESFSSSIKLKLLSLGETKFVTSKKTTIEKNKQR